MEAAWAGCCCGEKRQGSSGVSFLCSRPAVSIRPPSVSESGGFAKIKNGTLSGPPGPLVIVVAAAGAPRVLLSAEPAGAHEHTQRVNVVRMLDVS